VMRYLCLSLPGEVQYDAAYETDGGAWKPWPWAVSQVPIFGGGSYRGLEHHRGKVRKKRRHGGPKVGPTSACYSLHLLG
jgi:hypothetical protein